MMTDNDFDDNMPLLIEVTPGEAADDDNQTQEVLRLGRSPGSMVRQASDQAVRQAFITIYRMARRTGQMIDALQRHDDQIALDKIEIQFGLKFNGNVEAFIAEAGAEASVTVKITWNPGAAGDHD